MIYKGSIVKGSGGGSGDAVWGAITGTLSDQTDLAAALAEKQDVIDEDNKLDMDLVDGLGDALTGKQDVIDADNKLDMDLVDGLGDALTGKQDVIDADNKLSASYVSGLAPVATSGSYADLSNTPSIPTVNNATLTIKQNNASVGTFTANASSDVMLNLTDTTYSAFTGATGSVAGSAGLVPAPTTSDIDKYLKGDGTWATAGGLQNTSTGTNSLTILGYDSLGAESVNIGHRSITASYREAVSIGYYATSGGNFTTAIGGETKAEAVRAIAIGYEARATNTYSCQIGPGTNNEESSLYVATSVGNNWKVLDSSGKIPNDRINGASGSFTSQDGKTVTVTNGVITSIV